MNRHLFPLALLAAVVLSAASPACDRDDTDTSPPVTVGAAPANQAPDDGQPDPEADPTPQTDPGVAEQPTGDAASEFDPDLPDGSPEQQSLFLEARTAFLRNEYERAEAAFEQLAFDEPVSGQTVSAGIALGQIYLETGRTEEALQLFTELQQTVDDLPEVLVVLARTYAELDHPGLALDAYDRAYENQADYIFILPEMAQILVQQDQEERAAELLMRYEERLERMADKLEATDETSEQMRTYLVDILGLLHDERAHQALEHALRDDPAQPIRVEAANALGELTVFDAEDALRRAATEDDDEAVRATARQSLQTLRDRRAQFAQ